MTTIAHIEAQLTLGKANWPQVRHPNYLMRVQSPCGMGPTMLEKDASPEQDELREALAAKWAEGGDRYPNLLFPRGHRSSWSSGSEWWQAEGVKMSEWRCALRTDIIFYDGIRDSQVASMGRHLRHWFGGALCELAAANMQLVLLRIPDFQERGDTVYGDHGQSLYHAERVDEAGVIVSFASLTDRIAATIEAAAAVGVLAYDAAVIEAIAAEAAGEDEWDYNRDRPGIDPEYRAQQAAEAAETQLWELLARTALQAQAADQVSWRASEAKRIEDFKRERKRLQAKARRLRSQLMVA